jgi:pantoate--beta-alanine ligase
METVHTIAWMKQAAREVRAREGLLGLVPTMGALHEGHLSLIREAKRQCTRVAVSIFVNPKQFGPSEDLAKYPRPIERDRSMLEEMGVDYLFAPTAEEMYPSGFRTSVVVEGLSERLEGRSRPGHFRGVATVVLKLFEIVEPRLAFFGRKDAQQVRIIQQMSRDFDLDTEIVVCPIVRGPDGLAISSRNAYLSGPERRTATALYRSLEALRKQIANGERDVAQLAAALRSVIAGEGNVRLDYAEIVDAETLEPVPSLRKNCYALIAVFVGGARLIDNALIEETGAGFRVTL